MRPEVKRIQIATVIDPITAVTIAQPPLLCLSPYDSFGVTIYGNYNIQQGVGQAQRVGNRVTTRKCVLRMVFTPNPIAAQPGYLIMWIITKKNNSTVPAGIDSFFIQAGNASTYLSGNVFDTISEVNRDQWTLYKRRWWKVGYAGYTGQGTNNDFPLSKCVTLDITRYMPKTVVYNDATNNPSSKCVYACFEYVTADGTTVGTGACKVQSYLDYHYTDV